MQLNLNTLINKLNLYLENLNVALNNIKFYKPEFQENFNAFDYNYKQKYNPVQMKEVYNYLDQFLEDFFLYNQFYYTYYKLIYSKSDFNFTTSFQSLDNFMTVLDGQAYLKIPNFPIVFVNEFIYEFTPFSQDNTPSQKRQITFQVLGKFLEPSEGDVIHVDKFQFLIYKVERDIRNTMYLCYQKVLWLIEEFNSYVNENYFKVYNNLKELITSKEVKQEFEIIQNRIEKPEKLPKVTIIYKYIDRKPKLYDFDEVNLNTVDDLNHEENF